MSFDEKRFQPFERQFSEVYNYAQEKELPNTVLSVSLLPCFLLPKQEGQFPHNDDGVTAEIYMHHALSMAKLLIDVHPEITNEEEDIALSTAICHVLVEKVAFEKKGIELVSDYGLDQQVYDTIQTNLRKGRWDTEFYERIQQNKIALLVKLADRCNVIQQLYMSSISEAQKFINDTKHNFFSMCIYGKENYPDLYMVISLLMEKMRNLVDVMDIMSSRHIERENALHKEILFLKEENSRIRTIIKELKEGQ